jgi:type I restriction enzyme S subunit
MSFPRYPAYKPSGVEWLGEVPEHWELKRISSLYREVVEQGSDELPVLSVSIHHGVSDSELSEEEMDRKVTRSEDRSKYKRVTPGDLVYNMMRAWQGAFGTVCVEGMVSPAYVVARPTSNVPSTWIEYLLRTDPAISEIKRFSRGITDFRLRLYWDEFKNLRVCLPPSNERGVLLRFLDRETAKIDALIAEQQRLIELLQEKRQAVISHAVTKGLNPDAPMKDSGVEWLGEVPEHWEILELKRLKKEGSSITYGIVQAGPHIDDGVAYIRTSDMAGDRLILETCQRTSMEIDESYARSKVEAGDLVIAIRATVGKVLEVPIELHGANLTQGTAKFSPGARVDARFIKASFEADYCQSQIMSSAKGATFLEITLDALRRLKIAIPPLDEQEEVVEFLAGATSRLGDLLLAAQQTITLLQERRSALISAAVTGQIDVRGLVPEAVAA